MEQLFEALYEERRNAIPSWQGYHFQGMVALFCFLKNIVNKYEIDKNGELVGKLKLRIEWLEDFILYENENIKEIYQIKKTLTKTTRKEVLKNFIVQFKVLDRNDVKWFLGYNDSDFSDFDINQTEYGMNMQIVLLN